MVQLTENEKIVIRTFKDDDHVSDNGWNNGWAATWIKGFHKDCKMDGLTFSGTMSSLSKKDIIWTNGESFGLTDLGRKIAETI